MVDNVKVIELVTKYLDDPTPENVKAITQHATKLETELASARELADHWQEKGVQYYKDKEAVEKENQRLREALEFYADEKNWKLAGFDAYLMGIPVIGIGSDRGERAQQALRENTND